MKNMYDALVEYQASDTYPFHMPGHKRWNRDFVNPFKIDITEIHGYDNLHHAEGMIKEAQERAARLYHSEEAYFLINGSTCGILSAVSACTSKNGKILLARNCHKAAYHAVMLRELETVYLYPEREYSFGINGGILPESVEEALEKNENIQAVMITSPTYDGVVSDVKKIAGIVHRRGIPLIVDEAHGAHFGFHPYFPENSVKLGADIVIHSLHKTLPSFTQTALLHINGSRVDREKLRMYLGIYQSSSPSYVFMAGIDKCIQLIDEEGEELFQKFKSRLEKFYGEAENFSNIRLAGTQMIGHSGIKNFDRSKLVISVKNTGINGNCLNDILRRKYYLELEMSAGTYALALTSIADRDEGFQRLAKALREIDNSLDYVTGENKVFMGYKKKTMDDKDFMKQAGMCRKNGNFESQEKEYSDIVTENEKVYKICDALEKPGKSILLEQAEGEISREFLYLYPPGIPLLAPGERISSKVLERVKQLRFKGYSIQGLADYSAEKICVISGRKEIEMKHMPGE